MKADFWAVPSSLGWLCVYVRPNFGNVQDGAVGAMPQL